MSQHLFNALTPSWCVLTSARVGVGLVIMLSSMLVATITGLPRRRHPCTMRDCQNGTCEARHTMTQHKAVQRAMDWLRLKR